MKVILKADVESLGGMGELVDVRGGYGRNFLLPRNLAVVANSGQQKRLEHEKRLLEKRKSLLLAEINALAKKINKLVVKIEKQVGENNRIFGTVTTAEIYTAVKEQGLDIPRKQIVIEGDIKEIGDYKALVRLHSEVTATIKIVVVAQ